MAAIVIGVALLLCSLYAVLICFVTIERIKLLSSVSLQAVGDVTGQCLQMEKDRYAQMGREAVPKRVMIRGVPICETPLVSVLANEQCIFYRYEVFAVSFKRTKHGKKRCRTRLDRGEQSLPFMIDDGIAKIAIDPSKGTLFENVIKSVDDTQKEFKDSTITFGSFTADLSSQYLRCPDEIDFEESIIRADKYVTVVGMMHNRDGKFTIENDDKTSIIISPLSPADMIVNEKVCAILSGLSAVLLAASGIAVLIYHMNH